MREGREANERNRKNDRETKMPTVGPDSRVFWCIIVNPGVLFGTAGHHVLLLICHSARGSPAHLSRGPAVTVLMPKITSTNGREVEGTDQ